METRNTDTLYYTHTHTRVSQCNHSSYSPHFVPHPHPFPTLLPTLRPHLLLLAPPEQFLLVLQHLLLFGRLSLWLGHSQLRGQLGRQT